MQEPKFAPHLSGYRNVPFAGVFVWEEILLAQEQLVRTIDADWIVLVTPDEILHSNVPGETLASAIEKMDARGYNVINFDEFHFLPVDYDYIPDHVGIQPLRHYYFFKFGETPCGMRAWRKDLNLSNVVGAGHIVSGPDFRLAPETLVHRHYIFRNQNHAYEKYSRRVFDAKELARGWHWHGFEQPVANFAFPPADQLECLASHDGCLLPTNNDKWKEEDRQSDL